MRPMQGSTTEIEVKLRFDDAAAARERLELSERLTGAMPRIGALFAVIEGLNYLGDPEGARAHLEEARQLAEETDHLVGRAMVESASTSTVT